MFSIISGEHRTWVKLFAMIADPTFFFRKKHTFFNVKKTWIFFQYFSKILKSRRREARAISQLNPPMKATLFSTIFRFSLWDQAWNACTLSQRVVSSLQLPSEISSLHLLFWLMEPPYIYVHSEATKSLFDFYIPIERGLLLTLRSHFFCIKMCQNIFCKSVLNKSLSIEGQLATCQQNRGAMVLEGAEPYPTMLRREDLIAYPRPYGQTDMTENITLPQTTYTASNNFKNSMKRIFN